MDSYRPENVMNGTWGEAWINSDYMAEVTALQAKVTLNKVDVLMCRKLAKSSKVVGMECKGTLKLNKVSNYMAKLISDNIKQGKQTVCTIISKLADPDALGTERVALKNVTFDELTLVDWEAQKNGEESIPFTFDDWQYLDMV